MQLTPHIVKNIGLPCFRPQVVVVVLGLGLVGLKKALLGSEESSIEYGFWGERMTPQTEPAGQILSMHQKSQKHKISSRPTLGPY